MKQHEYDAIGGFVDGKHRHPVIRKMTQHEYDGLVVLLIKNPVFS